MKKVLIMTASTGHGHNQVANVLEQELKETGCRVKIADIFSEENPLLKISVSDAYNRMATSSSFLNGFIYRTSNQDMVNRGLVRLIYRLLHKPVQAVLLKEQADLIIITHPILINVLGELKLRGWFDQPIISVITDFDVHRLYVNQQIDAYIAGSPETSDLLRMMGISRSKIYINGIPVRRAFQKSSQKYGLDSRFNILLMGGSLGVKTIKRVLGILMRTSLPVHLVVVCGKNLRLKRELERKYLPKCPGHIELEILGFSSRIDELMDQADILFSKPGGITTTEAINKGVPIAVPFLIPGVEEGNCRILQEEGLVIKIERLKDIPQLVERVHSDPAVLRQISHRMKDFAKSYSMDSTILLCQDLIKRYSIQNEQHQG
ncbi:MAG TPA: glycosyltransferase [Syntrophomonas sp.]|nr:glycosyltransferase [Syntrophomonas sp.]